ncbi:predicted protein [Nematostella vectensis]|uniref:Uncharacterized protein n=1 Tax=Nematostella vectensis TaxID=45351 RepID=A7SRU3_NEMVE|nr:predicted protein [Nematostella vectensis]|eukprot:XP_001625677.1 predicted protein [Nematostella vectensis]
MQNNAYDTDSDNNSTSAEQSRVQSVTPTRSQSTPDWPPVVSTARPSTFSPLPAQESPEMACIEALSPKLTSAHDRENLASVQRYLGDSDVQNATKIYDKIMDLKRARSGPGFSRPQSTSAQNLTSQISAAPSTRDEVELASLLSSPTMQGLLLAHDRLAFREALPDENEENEGRELSRQNSSDADQSSQMEDDSVKIVRIDKSCDPLGATVKNEDGAVLIGRIVKGGAAEKSGLLHEGDEILEINGVHMKGKSVSEVCELLADMNGTLTFLLVPKTRSIGTLSRDRAVHVRANFDYDPYDDEFIPCRELGLAFRRGDILHVVDQEDQNWWQAWRAGEEGKKLAGLIPSKHFQQQRESMKHTVPADNEKTTEKSKKCLCIKRKRRKKVLYNAQQNEVFEVDQVLTYDEVDLLHPNPSRKRPIVLIGPPKIGRKELRQRLIQYDPDRFAGAIPHTSRPIKPGEINDHDYHFVPRHTFVTDIVAHKFVEHGELQDHFYGTSFDAIKMVINAGKTCILNLHCEALKTLRASNIKPYVIFISSPSYERVRALRRGKIDPFNPKLNVALTDREIHEMVAKAREMEEAYGHYFDHTITNTDFERTFDELRQVIARLEDEPQWVPVSWLR